MNRFALRFTSCTLFTAVSLFMALGLSTGSGRAQQGATGPEWRSYGGDTGSTKYSPLDQINRDTSGSQGDTRKLRPVL